MSIADYTEEEKTMNQDEIMKEILEHKLEIEKLQRKLDIYSKIPPLPEFTDLREDVYYVSVRFDEVCNIRYGDAIKTDFNMFHTDDYAKRAMLAAKMIVMQLHCKWYIDRDFVPDWNDNLQHKYTVYYSHTIKKFCVAQWSTHERTDVAFSSHEKAQMCADWLQENWKDYNYD